VYREYPVQTRLKDEPPNGAMYGGSHVYQPRGSGFETLNGTNTSQKDLQCTANGRSIVSSITKLDFINLG